MVTEAMVSMNKEIMTRPEPVARVEFLRACSGMRSGVDHGCLFVCFYEQVLKDIHIISMQT